ncbi:MAG: hypothetical protein MUO76_08785 [Anaerolineaceae bacterium]|nr:hypothetical protein [Anaerolineaceae bacterium]
MRKYAPDGVLPFDNPSTALRQAQGDAQGKALDSPPGMMAVREGLCMYSMQIAFYQTLPYSPGNRNAPSLWQPM